MSKKGAEVFKYLGSDGKPRFNVVFGRYLKDGHFQPSYAKPSREYKTEAGVKKAISDFENSED